MWKSHTWSPMGCPEENSCVEIILIDYLWNELKRKRILSWSPVVLDTIMKFLELVRFWSKSLGPLNNIYKIILNLYMYELALAGSWCNLIFIMFSEGNLTLLLCRGFGEGSILSSILAESRIMKHAMWKIFLLGAGLGWGELPVPFTETAILVNIKTKN